MLARLGVLFLLLAGPALAAAPGDEAERLRADMEGQADRLRLTVETFMAQQDHRIGTELAGQDRRIDDLHRVVWALSALSGVLALATGGLVLVLLRRRPSA